MFAKFPCYNASLESEDRLIHLDTVEEVLPHANVPVDPGAVDTECCEFRFYSGVSTVVLLSFADISNRLQALAGITDETGELS